MGLVFRLENREDPRVPYHWAKITNSPPKQRRNEVADICRQHDAKLIENETYYDDAGNVFALIKGPDDEAGQQALRDALQPLEWVGLVDADEKEAGKNPPHT
jgi:hypothetical protein